MDPLDEPPLARKLQRLAGTMGSIAHHTASLARVNNSIVDFNEGFAAFLYGMEMSMFCTEFVATPSDDDLKRHAHKSRQRQLRQRLAQLEHDNAMLEDELDQLRRHHHHQTAIAEMPSSPPIPAAAAMATSTSSETPNGHHHHFQANGDGRSNGDRFVKPRGPPLPINADTKSASALPAKRARPPTVWERLSRSKPGASTAPTPRRPPPSKGPRTNRAAELRAQQTRQRLAHRLANGRR